MLQLQIASERKYHCSLVLISLLDQIRHRKDKYVYDDAIKQKKMISDQT